MKCSLFSLVCCVALAGAFLLEGCNKTQVAASPTLTAVADVGCSVESGLASGVSASIAAQLQCTNTAAIQSSIQAALGNANLCSLVAPSVASANALKAKSVVAPKAIVGDIACPIVVNVVGGYLSNAVPAAWGCSAGAAMSSVLSALTAACEAAVPI